MWSGLRKLTGGIYTLKLVRVDPWREAGERNSVQGTDLVQGHGQLMET